MRTVTPSTASQSTEPPSATPKRAFATPRQPTVSPPSLRLSSSSSGTMSEVDLDIDEGADLDLAPTQSDALNSLKKMMTEEKLTTEQQRTLDSMRSAIKSVTEHEALKDIQLERTVTILSLASQLARESVELGIVPDSIFNSFATIDSRAMSAMTDSMSVKGWSAGTEKIMRSGKSVRKEPVIAEQQLTDREKTVHEVCRVFFSLPLWAKPFLKYTLNLISCVVNKTHFVNLHEICFAVLPELTMRIETNKIEHTPDIELLIQILKAYFT